MRATPGGDVMISLRDSGTLLQLTSFLSLPFCFALCTSNALMAKGVRSWPNTARMPTALRYKSGAAKLVP